MRQLTLTIAAMPVLVALTACFPTAVCEQPVPERVLVGGLTLGMTELSNAMDCLGDDEIYDLKIKAREGDPDAQAALGLHYSRTSGFDRDHERNRRLSVYLMRCAADGGSPAAQDFISTRYYWFKEERDAAKIVYKYAIISSKRKGCDCENLFQNPPPWYSVNSATNYCAWSLCPSMRDAKQRLNAAQIADVENEISIYKPSPRPCSVED